MGPPLARQRIAISMAFRWRADDGPLIVVSSPHQLKIKALQACNIPRHGIFSIQRKSF